MDRDEAHEVYEGAVLDGFNTLDIKSDAYWAVREQTPALANAYRTGGRNEIQAAHATLSTTLSNHPVNGHSASAQLDKIDRFCRDIAANHR